MSAPTAGSSAPGGASGTAGGATGPGATPSLGAGGAANTATSRVSIFVEAPLGYGQSLVLLSSEPERTVPLFTAPDRYPVWSPRLPLDLPVGVTFKFRLATYTAGEFESYESPMSRSLMATTRAWKFSCKYGDPTTAAVSMSLPSEAVPDVFGTGPRSGPSPRRNSLPNAPPSIPEAAVEEDSDSTPVPSPRPSTAALAQLSTATPGTTRPAVSSPLTEQPRVPSANSTDPPISRPASDAPITRELSGSMSPLSPTISPNDASEVMIVLYHLPVRVVRTADTGAWNVSWDEDALLSTKQNVKNGLTITWIGTVPATVPIAERPILEDLLVALKCYPLWLDQQVAEDFTTGFCHDTLIPIMHNSVGVYSKQATRWLNGVQQKRRWDTYRLVNRMFANAAMQRCHHGQTVIWVHGYHLLMCPSFLVRKGMHVGLFVHTPFPSSEVFRTLSCADELLRAMLAADHIGFHAFEYARHFGVACTSVLHATVATEPGIIKITLKGHDTALTVCHAGVEPEALAGHLAAPDTQGILEHFRAKFANKTVILAVDRINRLDGITLKLHAYRRLLAANPALVGKTVLVQVTLGVMNKQNHYDLASELSTEIDQLSAMYGEGVAFHEHMQTASTPRLMAYYSVAHIYCNSAMRSGLCLRPLEYVFVQQQKELPGVVLISEFCAAYRCLGGAIVCNPYDTAELAHSMQVALGLSPDTCRALHAQSWQFVSFNTATSWARIVLQDLTALVPQQHMDDKSGRLLDGGAELELNQAFRRSPHRVIFVDYGGTLSVGESAETLGLQLTQNERINMEHLPPKVHRALEVLSLDRNTTIIVVSGQRREPLARAFNALPGVPIAAENGFYWRDPSNIAGLSTTPSSQWNSLMRYDLSWKQLAANIMRVYARVTYGSYVVEKGSSVIWYFGSYEREFSSSQAKELQRALQSVLGEDYEVDVISGYDYVEVRPRGVNKGLVVRQVLHAMKQRGQVPEFVLVAGDDEADEYMFRAAKDWAAEVQSPMFKRRSMGTGGGSAGMGRTGSSANLSRSSGFTGVSSMTVQDLPSLTNRRAGGGALGTPTVQAPHASVYTITVGKKHSTDADYYVHDKLEMGRLMVDLASHCVAATSRISTPSASPAPQLARPFAPPPLALTPHGHVQSRSGLSIVRPQPQPTPPPPSESRRVPSFDDFMGGDVL